MSTLTENIIIQSIKVDPATGTIEVERVTQVLRDGDVIATGAPAIQKLTPDQDLAAMGLETLVMAVAGAAWTPEHVEAATGAMFSRMHAQHLDMEAQHVQRQAEHDQRLAALERSREAVAAAHLELDAEHATLNERSDAISRRRADLFQQSEALRASA